MRFLVAASLFLVAGCGSSGPMPVTDFQRCLARFDPCGTSQPEGTTLVAKPEQRAKQIVWICLAEAQKAGAYDATCDMRRDSAGDRVSALVDACAGMDVPFACCDELTAAAVLECTPGAIIAP